MNIKLIFGLVVVGAISAFGQGATNLEVRTKADKVNLRVRPEAASEVVGQVGEGQVLAVTRIEGEWLGVVAPTNAGVWVKSQFVKDGVATGDKIRLRAGPGIGFRDVGLLRKGDKVVARDTHGEWLRIAPPEGLILWVSQTLVDLPVVAPVVVEAVTNVPVAMVATGTVVRVEAPAPVFTNSVFARDLPAGLTKKDLAPQLGQGLMVERAGVVERVPFGFFRGAYFALAEIRDGQKTIVCYLEGNNKQMPSLVGQRLTVMGREYRLKGRKYSTVYPELIKPIVDGR